MLIHLFALRSERGLGTAELHEGLVSGRGEEEAAAEPAGGRRGGTAGARLGIQRMHCNVNTSYFVRYFCIMIILVVGQRYCIDL